jgi:uncharacterized protein YndB with AHSA1/START domain
VLGAATRSFVLERDMPHPPERIWRALAQGPLIEQWLMKNDFRPIVGHGFTFGSTPATLERRHELRSPDSRTPETARLQLELLGRRGGERPEDSGHMDSHARKRRYARVRMEQSGFESKDEAGYQGAGYGWPRFVDGLERVAAGLD